LLAELLLYTGLRTVYALKVVDLAMFGCFSQEGFHASIRGAISHITLVHTVMVALHYL
jgi:hypothetical protein